MVARVNFRDLGARDGNRISQIVSFGRGVGQQMALLRKSTSKFLFIKEPWYVTPSRQTQ
jgi:hypothetical protein